MINYRFITAINSLLGISTPITFSNDFNLTEGKTERLVDLCIQREATDYYTGPAAKDYLDENLFQRKNINVHYLDFTGYPEYPQLFPPFEHNVTILDLIFNTGADALKYMKSFSTTPVHA